MPGRKAGQEAPAGVTVQVNPRPAVCAHTPRHYPARRQFRPSVSGEPPNAGLGTALAWCVAGLTFLLPAGGGLYWLIPAVVCSLVGGVINAWLFLVRV